MGCKQYKIVCRLKHDFLHELKHFSDPIEFKKVLSNRYLKEFLNEKSNGIPLRIYAERVFDLHQKEEFYADYLYLVNLLPYLFLTCAKLWVKNGSKDLFEETDAKVDKRSKAEKEEFDGVKERHNKWVIDMQVKLGWKNPNKVR